MSQNETLEIEVETKAEVVQAETKKDDTLVDAVFDLGLAWAEYGIGHGKHALESSARVLERTAKVLETLQSKLRHDPA